VSVVIDASALVAFVTKEPASPKVAQLLHDWGSQETPLNAPELARYEIANALAKKAANGELDDDAIDEAWDVLDDLPIVYHPLHDGRARCASRLLSNDAPRTTPPISPLPRAWTQSYGRSTGHLPATPTRTATRSISSSSTDDPRWPGCKQSANMPHTIR
jgi:predicted nucleic acid-binding protein